MHNPGSENAEAHKAHGNSKVIMLLHWLLAAMVLYLFASSWWMLGLPLPSAEYTYRELPFQLHKNIGLTLVVLLLVMLWWRLSQRSRHASAGSGLLDRLAALDHWLIYILVMAVCVSGYLSSSYSGWDTEFWWLIKLPAWAAENDALNILFSDIHQWTCWLLLMLIGLHIGAAIYHGLRNDDLLHKMFP